MYPVIQSKKVLRGLTLSRVRRSELLYSRSASIASDATSLPKQDQPNASPEPQPALDLDFDIVHQVEAPPLEASQDHEALNDTTTEPEGYAFRLFSTSNTTTTTAVRPDQPSSASYIRIRTPTPDPDALKGHLTTSRPLSYYLTSALSNAIRLKLQAQYSSSAITPEELERLAETPWPGTRLPWRVRHLPSPTSKAAPSSALRRPPDGRGKTKPNKKRRIALRKHTRRRVVEKAKTELTAKAAEEKRKTKNRTKKLKRRAKKKEKAKGQDEGERSPVEEKEGGVGNAEVAPDT